MDHTTWPGAPSAASLRSAQVTIDDYGKFSTWSSTGVSDRTAMLSSPPYADDHDQVSAYTVLARLLRRPAQFLARGCWLTCRTIWATVVVSSNSGEGFYPWVDHDPHVGHRRRAGQAAPGTQCRRHSRSKSETPLAWSWPVSVQRSGRCSGTPLPASMAPPPASRRGLRLASRFFHAPVCTSTAHSRRSAGS